MYKSHIMVPFKETINTKQELIEACKKGFEDYSKNIITKNDFCMFFGFTHGKAITTFYEGKYEQLLIDGGFNSGSSAYFSAGIKAWKNLQQGIYEFPPFIQNPSKLCDQNKSIQIIYYGCPGSGKSYKVKDITNSVNPDFVFRTTFHPDTDYASFVGCYKPSMNDGNIEYNYSAQVFTNAYVKTWQNPGEKIYLIIEEINRGNCAQIFGDLFQLLDRDKATGKSEYPIKADKDLAAYIEKELGSGHEGIRNGELCLPPNLIIYATMNTSDQSLFPMDSAFKRRWDWEYVPINYDKNIDSGKFTINIDGTEYLWVDFLEKVNDKIYDATNSEDKQMGNFFIKKSVDAKEFINKVMFYLWNEVCKEEYGTKRNFFRKDKDGNTEFKFTELFGENQTTILNGFMTSLYVEPIKSPVEE